MLSYQHDFAQHFRCYQDLMFRGDGVCVKLCWYKSVVCEVVLAQWFKVMLLQKSVVESYVRTVLCELVN